jgi:hypothetical protein
MHVAKGLGSAISPGLDNQAVRRSTDRPNFLQSKRDGAFFNRIAFWKYRASIKVSRFLFCQLNRHGDNTS